MHDLTDEQLANIFSRYTGNVICLESGIHYTLTGVSCHEGIAYAYTEQARGKVLLRTCRLMLAPLSEITDADAFELAKIILAERHLQDQLQYTITHRSQVSEKCRVEITITIKGGTYSYLIRIDQDSIFCMEQHIRRAFNDKNLHVPFQFEMTQLLLNRGYALPLFIAPEHTDNGRTALELGIGILKSHTGTWKVQNDPAVADTHLPNVQRLNKIEDRLLKLQLERKKLDMEKRTLKKSLVKGKRASSSNSNNQELIALLVRLIQQKNRPISLPEICGEVENKHSDLIPSQIVDLKSYIKKHLVLACEQDAIKSTRMAFLTGTYYTTNTTKS